MSRNMHKPHHHQYPARGRGPLFDSRERPYSPPQMRRSPSQDSYRAPARGDYTLDGRSGRHDRDGRRERDAYHDSGRGRAISPPPRRYERRDYRDRDREGYRSPRYDSPPRSRSRSHSRSRRRRSRSPYYGGPPSREVILEGLPIETTDEDIRNELQQNYNIGILEDVRVIRDKKTGISRQFGFLRFYDIDTSTTFMRHNYPAIHLRGKSANGIGEQEVKIRIAFSRERDSQKSSGDEWKCANCSLVNFSRRTECFRCHAPRTDSSILANTSGAKPPQFVNTGDSDAAVEPSQFIILRGLEPSVTEELLAKGVSKLCRVNERSQNASGASTRKEGAKVLSTTSSSNLGASEGSIKRVFIVRDRRSGESWRFGLAEFKSIEDAQAAVTKYNAVDKFTISSKPVLVDYIHAGVFVPLIGPRDGHTERFSFSASSDPSLRLKYWDDGAYVSELEVMANVGGTKAALSQGNQSAAPNPDPNKEGLIAIGDEGSGKSRKRKGDAGTSLGTKKTVPSHLQFWSNRHAELHGVGNDKSNGDHSKPSDANQNSAKILTTGEEKQLSRSYADPNKKCCYLCSRQFKSETEVNKHERLSKLHMDNLNNEDLKSKAMAKLEAAGLLSSSSESKEYRDRARERRAAFNQPKKPSNKAPQPAESKADEEPEAAPVPSKGASLLGKMGWTEGKGLGAQGTGMVAPIATDLYAQGVGLGAEGGKLGDASEEASRNTDSSYSAFVERTKDKVKERYQQMS